MLVGLICGLALVPAGFYSLLMAWDTSSLAPTVLVFAVFVLLLAFGCAVVVGVAGGRAAVGALAPLIAGGLLAGWYLQADALVSGPGTAMLATGIIGGATAAVGQPRIGTIGRLVAGAVLLSPALVPAVLSAFTTFGDFRERAAAHGVPYTLAGPGYEEQYIALGEGSSVAVYQMPDGEEVHVSSTATVHDDRSRDGLTFGECHEKPFDNGEAALECVAHGPGFEVRLVSFGAADEADLAEAFEHLRAMSDWTFYQEARRYVEVLPD
ncbi:hypothetical protein [Promicromonospora kroppenstedtii]|uniref:hypothetical protein n=1 Tax=Promicromonospora kroppenstedtii TaxID=440482 RepID=UPI00055DD951|nr:hypothetical protein [Promicromonospora kroppenstedtii]